MRALPILAALGIGSAALAVTGDRGPAPSAAAPAELPIWPAGLAIQRPESTAPETVSPVNKLVGGKPWTYITNVARPTIRIFPPKGRNSGAALMVLPGGGYYGIAIDIEGTEICDWATRIGMTCIVLKYRSPQDWHKDRDHEKPPAVQLALQDAERAMGIVRARAAALRIDPRRVGVIGFSAGGHLATAVSNAALRNYRPVDAADRLPFRPNFAIVCYPGHLWAGSGLRLSPWNRISAAAPPTFMLHAMDDPIDDVHHSLAYAAALREAKVPVEMHLYADGGHAFGLRRTGRPVDRWPALAEQWLRANKVLPPPTRR